MHRKIHRYPIFIKETDLDAYAHVNHTHYFKYFEDARWDYITQNGYGFKKIHDSGIGPVILEANIRYVKELRLHDKVVIETEFVSYEKKIGKIVQKMMRGDALCCVAEFTIALFDLKERKLVIPTEDWLKAICLNHPES